MQASVNLKLNQAELERLKRLGQDSGFNEVWEAVSVALTITDYCDRVNKFRTRVGLLKNGKFYHTDFDLQEFKRKAPWRKKQPLYFYTDSRAASLEVPLSRDAFKALNRLKRKSGLDESHIVALSAAIWENLKDSSDQGYSLVTVKNGIVFGEAYSTSEISIP